MYLTFAQNTFILTNFDTNPTSSQWAYDKGTNTFRTNNIEAAYTYKRYASSTVKNIFKKLRLTSVPSLSVRPLVPSTLKLKKFQSELGVPFILSRNKSYLAHEPGLGKSAQVVAAVNTNPGPALISPPAFLKINWAREITKWSLKWPNISIVPESDKAETMDWGADWVICPHSMLTKPWIIEGITKNNFKYKVVDEVQVFQTPGAARSVALWGGKLPGKIVSPGLMFDCDHEIYLSGTPLLSKPIDIWPILYGAAPQTIDFMPYRDFGFRFCGPRQDPRGNWIFNGSSREAELHKRLTSGFMQVVKKEDVLKDLPKKIRTVIPITSDPRDAETKELDRQLLREFNGDGVEKPKSMGAYAMLHHRNGLAKVNWAAQFVAHYLTNDPNEQIVLFGYHRDVCEKLAALLKGFTPEVILGQLKQSERSRIVDQFQSKERRLIIGNDAMIWGLTMTAGVRTVHAEYSTSPSKNSQAEDRTNRIGSAHEFSYHQYLVLPGSLDEVRLQSFLRRENAINKIIY